MENSNSNNNHNNYKNNKNIPGGGEAQSANQPLFPAATTATGNLIFDQNSRDSMQIIQMSPLPAPPSSSSSSSTIIPTAAALDSDSDSDPNLDTSHSHQLLMAWPPLLSGCGVDALAPVSAGERMQEGEELPNHHHLQLLHEYNLQQQQQQQQDADSSSSSSSTPVVADDDDATDQDDHAMMLLATHATSAAEAGVDNLDSNEQQQQQPNPDHQVVVYYDQTAYGKCMQTEIRRILSYKNKFDVSEPDYRRLLINYSDSRWDEVYIEQLDRPTLKRRRPVLFDQPQQLQPSNLQRYHDQMMVFEGSGNQEQQQHLFLHQQHVMKKPRTDNYMESDQQVSLLDSSSSTTFELNNTMVATDTSTSASIAATTGNGIEDADIIDEAASASSISWGAYVSVLMQGGEDEYDDKEGGDKDDEDDESDIDDIDHHDTDDGDDTIPSSSFPSSSDSSTDTVLASSNTPSSSSSVMDLYLAPYARLDLLNMDDGCSAHHKGRFTKRDIGYDHKLSFESYLRNSRESLVAMYQNRINSIRRQIVKVHQQAYTFPSPLPTPSPPLLSNTTDHQDHHNHPSDDSSNVSDMNDYSISNEALSTTPLCDTNPPSASTSSSCTAPLLGIDDTNTPSTASSFPAFVCNIDDTTSDENSNNNNNENMDTLSSAQIDHHYPQQHHHHFQQDIIIPDSCGSVNAPSDTKPCTMPVACLLEHTRQLEENAQQSLQQQHQNDFQQQQQHQENYYPHDQQQQVVMHQYSPLPSDESSLPATTEAHPPSPPPNQEQQQQFHHQQQQQQHQQQQQLSPTHPHTTPVIVNGIVKYLDQQTLSYIQSLEIQIFRLSQKMQAITYCLASSASSSLSSSSAMNCEGGGEGGGGDHASIEAAGLDLLGFKQQQQRLDETSSGCVQLQQQE